MLLRVIASSYYHKELTTGIARLILRQVSICNLDVGAPIGAIAGQIRWNQGILHSRSTAIAYAPIFHSDQKLCTYSFECRIAGQAPDPAVESFFASQLKGWAQETPSFTNDITGQKMAMGIWTIGCALAGVDQGLQTIVP